MFKSFKNRLTDSENEPNNTSAAHEGKGIVSLWSSLGEDTHKAVEQYRSLFACEDLTLFSKGDEPLNRDPWRALDHGQAAWGGDLGIRKELRVKFGQKAEIFMVLPVDGAGMTAVKAAQPFKELPLEVATNFLVGSPNPREHERVCRAINLATIDPRSFNQVFLTKADHDENEAYPRQLAQIMLTFRWIDSTNTFSRAAAYQELEPSGVTQTRQAIQQALQELKEEFGSRPQELFGFDPAVYVADPQAIDVWAETQYEAFVRIPAELYEGTSVTENLGTAEIDVDAKPAPVKSVHVILTRQLSSEFITHTKTDHLRWLYENADTIDHWRKIIESRFGYDADPREKLDHLVRNGLGVNHPAVDAVFEDSIEMVEQGDGAAQSGGESQSVKERTLTGDNDD